MMNVQYIDVWNQESYQEFSSESSEAGLCR